MAGKGLRGGALLCEWSIIEIARLSDPGEVREA